MANPSVEGTNRQADAKSSAESNKNGDFQLFAYPSDVGGKDHRHYMLFNINIPNTSSFKNVSLDGGTENGTTMVADPTARGRLTTSVGGFENTSLPSSIQSLDVFRNGSTRIAAAIVLPIPPQIGTSYGTNWATTDIGMDLAIAGSLVSAVQTGGLEGASQLASDTVKAITLQSEAGRAAAVTVLKAANEGVGAVASKLQQAFSNPYTEVTFQGVQNRTFSFQWKFTFNNSKEAQEFRNILKMFKFHMLPEITGGQSSIMRYPSQFDISFHYVLPGTNVSQPNDKNLFRLDTCALTGMEVNYAPSGQFRTFADGMPVEVDVTLQFQEMTVLTKNKVNEGYF